VGSLRLKKLLTKEKPRSWKLDRMVWISTKGTVVTFTVLHVWCFQCCADIRWHQTRPMFRQCNGYIRQCFKDLVDAPDRVSSPNTREVFFFTMPKVNLKKSKHSSKHVFLFLGPESFGIGMFKHFASKDFPPMHHHPTCRTVKFLLPNYWVCSRRLL